MFAVFYNANDLDLGEVAGLEPMDYFKGIVSDPQIAIDFYSQKFRDDNIDDETTTIQVVQIDEDQHVVQLIDEDGEWIEQYTISKYEVNKLT